MRDRREVGVEAGQDGDVGRFAGGRGAHGAAREARRGVTVVRGVVAVDGRAGEPRGPRPGVVVVRPGGGRHQGGVDGEGHPGRGAGDGRGVEQAGQPTVGRGRRRELQVVALRVERVHGGAGDGCGDAHRDRVGRAALRREEEEGVDDVERRAAPRQRDGHLPGPPGVLRAEAEDVDVELHRHLRRVAGCEAVDGRGLLRPSCDAGAVVLGPGGQVLARGQRSPRDAEVEPGVVEHLVGAVGDPEREGHGGAGRREHGRGAHELDGRLAVARGGQDRGRRHGGRRARTGEGDQRAREEQPREHEDDAEQAGRAGGRRRGCGDGTRGSGGGHAACLIRRRLIRQPRGRGDRAPRACGAAPAARRPRGAARWGTRDGPSAARRGPTGRPPPRRRGRPRR